MDNSTFEVDLMQQNNASAQGGCGGDDDDDESGDKPLPTTTTPASRLKLSKELLLSLSHFCALQQRQHHHQLQDQNHNRTAAKTNQVSLEAPLDVGARRLKAEQRQLNKRSRKRKPIQAESHHHHQQQQQQQQQSHLQPQKQQFDDVELRRPMNLDAEQVAKDTSTATFALSPRIVSVCVGGIKIASDEDEISKSSKAAADDAESNQSTKAANENSCAAARNFLVGARNSETTPTPTCRRQDHCNCKLCSNTARDAHAQQRRCATENSLATVGGNENEKIGKCKVGQSSVDAQVAAKEYRRKQTKRKHKHKQSGCFLNATSKTTATVNKQTDISSTCNATRTLIPIPTPIPTQTPTPPPTPKPTPTPSNKRSNTSNNTHTHQRCTKGEEPTDVTAAAVKLTLSQVGRRRQMRASLSKRQADDGGRRAKLLWQASQCDSRLSVGSSSSLSCSRRLYQHEATEAEEQESDQDQYEESEDNHEAASRSTLFIIKTLAPSVLVVGASFALLAALLVIATTTLCADGRCLFTSSFGPQFVEAAAVQQPQSPPTVASRFELPTLPPPLPLPQKQQQPQQQKDDDQNRAEEEVLLPFFSGNLLDKLYDGGRLFLMAAIIICDILGNSLVILSVCRHKKLRVTTNWFVVSLACADILVALFAMTFNTSVSVSNGRWLFAPWVCDFWNSCDVLFSTASILHLCCISIDRYVAIITPLDYPMKITTRRVMYSLCAVWVASALLSYIPFFTGIYTTEEHLDWRRLHPDKCELVVNRVYAIVSSSVSFWIPCCIMVFTYYRIYKEAARQEEFIHKTQAMMKPAALVAPPNHHHSGSSASGGSGGASGCAGRTRRSRSVAATGASAGADKSRIRLLAKLAGASGGSNAAAAKSQQHLQVATTNLALATEPSSQQADSSSSTKHQQQQPNQNNCDTSVSQPQQDEQDFESGSDSSTPTKQSATISKMKREHKAAKTLGIIMGAFILCWLPFFVWYTSQNICGPRCDNMLPNSVVTVLFWIGYFNSTLNPFIYAYFNSEFRQAFKLTLKWLFCYPRRMSFLRTQKPNDNQHYNCTYRSTQEIGLVSNG